MAEDTQRDSEDIADRAWKDIANHLGVTPDELDNILWSEIHRRQARIQKQKYINGHVLRGVRYKIRKWIHDKNGGQPLMFMEYED